MPENVCEHMLIGRWFFLGFFNKKAATLDLSTHEFNKKFQISN